MPPANHREGYRFDVSVPRPFLGVDPFKVLLGISLDDVFESLLAGPVNDLPNGQRVYPLILPEGEPLLLSLRQYGTLGFGCCDHDLHLWVPRSWQLDVEKQIQPDHRWPCDSVTAQGAPCLRYRLRFPPGTGTMLRLGVVGAIGIRVPDVGGGFMVHRVQ